MDNKEKYSKTLHLPKTDFPMKAKLSEREPEFVEKWNKNQIHQKVLNKRKDSETFFLLDGPPYSNGSIHIGHTLNKILKDIVLKYKSLKGFKAPFFPTWDCHGLPIELKAIEKNKGQDMTDTNLRQLCRKEAHFWMENQRESFKRLGVLADWEKPVLTMDPSYEAEETRIFAKLVHKGLIYRGAKPVFWCFKLQTALAFSEAEYRKHVSPSIYVKFYLDSKGQKRLKSNQPVSAVIWTTTPWTLPANSAICLHPDFEYGLYKGAKESYLIACPLAPAFFELTGLSPLQKQSSFKGKDLEGLVSLHPFMDRKSPLILGDHVSLEAGTGLVHTAPGHGLEDYLVGKKYQLKEHCPVDERGHFTEELPEGLKGLFILKGNKIILEWLRKTGHLLSHKEITHSYPYNPRSNSPLIYRLTPQWFLSLDQESMNDSLSVRSKALSACEKDINFIPDWGKSRLEAMIKSSPDWCLSRQRVWGVPLVVFYCKACKSPLLNAQIINKIADKMENSGEGIEYYFSREEKDLLPKDLKCNNCGHPHFQKGSDILDVWFDSGIQHFVFTQIKGLKGKPPIDLFLEGSDQHRGWFQTSLLSSLALNEQPPFKTLLTHGFVNDQQGYKMSKSKGNVLAPESIIQRNGAEILRLWTASENFAFDINAGEESFQRVTESYRRFRNSFRFILGNLNNFEFEKNQLEFKDLNLVDQWMLGQLNILIKDSIKAFDDFAFYKLYQKLNHFFTVKLSAFYLDIVKDRLYTFSQRSLERVKAQNVLYHLIDKLLPLMAPVTSFLSEEAYSYLPKKREESVFLEDYPKEAPEWYDEDVQNLFLKMFPLREQINRCLEELRKKGDIGSNLQAKVEMDLEKDFITSVMGKQEQLEFFGVSQLQINEEKSFKLKVKKAQGQKCVRCWFISQSLNEHEICSKCVKNLGGQKI